MYYLYDTKNNNHEKFHNFLITYWKKEKGKNLLLLTGLSGSGKSTLASHLQATRKETVQLVRLDKFILGGEGDDLIKRWYDKEGNKYQHTDWYAKDVYKTDAYFEAFQAFFTDLIEWTNKNPDVLYIAEGIQFFYPSMLRYLEQTPTTPLILLKEDKVQILKNFIERNQQVVKTGSVTDILSMIENNLQWNERNRANFNLLYESIQIKMHGAN